MRSPLRATIPVSAKPIVIARKAQIAASASMMTPAASPIAPTSTQIWAKSSNCAERAA
jgi:hypothetical protein